MSSPQESIMDAYWQLPPMARTMSTATFVLSIAIHFGLLSGGLFIHHPLYIWNFPPQIWRFVTCFLITGKGLSMIFEPYMLYQYMSQLEVGHPRFRRREDLLWYLFFVGGVILTTNYLVGLPFFAFLPALILSLCYTVTQDQRGMKTTFYIITIPAQLTPYCMMLINLLFENGVYVIMLQMEGLFAAHLFDFLTRIWPEFGGGRNLISTPAFMSNLVRTPRILHRTYGTAIRGTNQDSGRSTGAERGPLPDSWRTRGPGQRLG